MFFLYPCLLFLVLFVISFCIEKRRFRNCIYLTFFLSFLLLFMAENQAQNPAVAVTFILFCLMLPIALIIVSLVFITMGVSAIRHEGKRLMNFLSIAGGIGIWGLYGLTYVLFFVPDLPDWLFGLLILAVGFGCCVVFTFFSFWLYSRIYLLLPKVKNCDYIIILGAGLLHGDRVSPLLAGRIEKGMKAYERSQRRAKIIVSGGQGSDETISEAEGMKRYLTAHGIPESDIIKEDKSTDTMENLRNSKLLIEEIKQGEKYRCVFVTSDYHVFRAGLYAMKMHLRAEGIGSRTAFYYWPNAFIREYIALVIHYKWVPISMFLCWCVFYVLLLLA